MQNVPNIGKILTGNEQRDAIHIAIAPVIATEKLVPGFHVGLDCMGRATRRTENYIGIVDPFLPNAVDEGQLFYLFLYPNTVASLRHEWTHPAFAPYAPPPGSKDESERWLMEYAKKHNCYDVPDVAFKNLIEGLRNQDLFFHGDDLHGLYELDDAYELKQHAENYLGIVIDWDRFSFSCSC